MTKGSREPRVEGESTRLFVAGRPANQKGINGGSIMRLLVVAVALVLLVVAVGRLWALERDSSGPASVVGEEPVEEEPVEEESVGEDAGSGVAEAVPSVEGRSGLLHSPEEVVLWRQRAQQGPYRVAGDVSANSPGDWSRIRLNADRFVANPSAGRWQGPPQGDLSTCVQQWDGEPPTGGPSELRDAAFVALVTGEERFATEVKSELLWQASAPGTDFSNRSRWCPGVLMDVNPGFIVTWWLTKLLLAYDYLGPEAFSAEEQALLDEWFLEAARFFQVDLDESLSRLFADRGRSERLSRSIRINPDCGGNYFLGSRTTCTLNRHYNNRRATTARFVGLVGVHQQDDSLKESARQFVEEFLMYGVFPEAFVADFLRGTPDKPMLGFAYGANTVAPVLTIADAFARSGDTSLYEYTTSVGAFGSEGGAKNLLFAARSFGKHVDGTYRRYVRDSSEDPDYLIDGEWAGMGFLHDVAFAQANVYFQDDYLRQAYTRSGSGMDGYPSRVASNGPHPVWTGEGGIFPGVLFMYGQTEGIVWPY